MNNKPLVGALIILAAVILFSCLQIATALANHIAPDYSTILYIVGGILLATGMAMVTDVFRDNK